MICAVCLNPCIDRTVEIEEFTYAGMNRILTSRSDGCGKGVNVALASRELGMDSALIGYLYEDNGRRIADRLEDAGCAQDCIWLPGQVRTNLKIFDRKNKKITEVNESGERVSNDAQQEMIEKVREYAGLSDLSVKEGDKVNAGQQLGTAGIPPFESDLGVHVHFEYLENGKYADPAEQMAAQ